jgi:putative transposase
MPRIARVVISGQPHHVVQRGNRGQRVFFCDSDKKTYLTLLKEKADEAGIKLWAYCLMDNHVHLIAIPEKENSLAQGIGRTHMAYTSIINRKKGWKGFLWQGRFMSSPLDEKYLHAAMRYVENNPVRAGIVKRAEDYLWSSAKAHVLKEKNKLLEDNFMTNEFKNWAEYLSNGDNKEDLENIRANTKPGRPVGDVAFVKKIEVQIGRILQKKKPGPK